MRFCAFDMVGAARFLQVIFDDTDHSRSDQQSAISGGYRPAHEEGGGFVATVPDLPGSMSDERACSTIPVAAHRATRRIVGGASPSSSPAGSGAR